MPAKKCCRTCEHCGSSQAVFDGWCRLRELAVHAEIAPYVFCHHWTQKAPMLPTVKENLIEPCMERQLEFGRELVGSIGVVDGAS